MPNYNGNPGNRGGGRKSAYQERKDAKLLHEMFFTAMTREEITRKLKTGKYSIKELFVSKAFAGNEKFILAMFHKIFPDKMIHAGDPDAPIAFELLQNQIGGMPDEMLAELASGKVIEGEFAEIKEPPKANEQPSTTISPAGAAQGPAGPDTTIPAAPEATAVGNPAPDPGSSAPGTSAAGVSPAAPAELRPV